MKKLILLLFVFFIGFISCDTKHALKKSSGLKGEMLVVNNVNQINKRLGMLLNDTIGVSYPGLVFHEPMTQFRFLNKSTYKKKFIDHHSVLKIEKGAKSFELLRDVQSSPQLIIKVSGNNQAVIFNQIIENRSRIIKEIENVEKEFIKLDFKHLPVIDLKSVFNTRGFDLKIPATYTESFKNDSVFWYTRLEGKDAVNLLVTIHKANQLDSSKIIPFRNKIGQAYVRNNDSVYMTTAKLVTPYISKVDNYYMAEGMWEMKNDFMGGNFLSKSYFNPKTNEVIVLETFLYAPRENTGARGMKIFKDNPNKKRDLLRESQVIFDSFKLL